LKKLSYYKDVLYANQYFDILVWWIVYGINSFLRLTLGANSQCLSGTCFFSWNLG
jgi:hypothetical protein